MVKRMWKYGRFARLRFCPECGTETFELDRNTGARQVYEYTCHVCGIGIRVQPSTRYQKACSYLRADRKIRPPEM